MTNKCPGHHLGISGGGAGADPEHTGGDHVSLLPWEHFCPPPGRAGGGAGNREV